MEQRSQQLPRRALRMLTNKHFKDFAIRATDGELGTVDDIYFDDETWAIRYLIVDTGGWLGGRRVLILANFRNPYGLGGQASGCGADKKAG
jgi:uncharacterized protein YrrD